jgi:RimJ/RimL family protein N-acetyltransferase
MMLPQEVLEAHRRGVSSTQIALDRFFTSEENKQKLREIYKEMTGRVEATGLGYYKFEDRADDLIGGGALAPISDDARKVDVALHILKPRQGIGSHCLERLLDIAFKEKGVEQVWGSSIIDHPGTPTLCAKHGMIIQNIDGMKYYFIDRRMREASEGKAEEVVRKNPIAASTHYGKDGSDSGRGGR